MAHSTVGAGGRRGDGVGTPPDSLREVGVPVGTGPLVPAVGSALVGPGGEGLQPVMSSAQAGKAIGVSLPGWSAFVEWHVGDDVVEVAVAGVDAAAGEHAMLVAEDDLFPHHRWGVVGVTGAVRVEVQHRPHREPANSPCSG